MSGKISVALGTYNGEKHLQAQLDSLRNQTVLPYELVICDDGSNDNTLQIIRDFAESAPFPVHLHVNETNLGFADNFLRAANLCQGDWISFCDQDDVWLPRKFQCVIQAIERYGSDELVLIGHTSLMANGDLVLNGQRLPNYKKDKYIKCASQFGFFCIVGFSMVFRASLIKNFDANLRPTIYRQQEWTPPGHDQWIGMLANAVGDTAYISEPLAIWRRHATSLTSPPKPTTLIKEARIASSALIPDPYQLFGNMCTESAAAFRRIANGTLSQKDRRNLDAAALGFDRLAFNFFNRAALYGSNTFKGKFSVLIRLVKSNAYLGPRYSSLGFRSFIKDLAFTAGIIG
jgi:glycosyltransferase involved in cell wall biosynthesis